MRPANTILAALLAAATLPAQNQPGAIWSNGNSPTLGGRNAFPWGSCGLRYQQIIDASIVSRVCAVNDIFVAGDSGLSDRTIEHTDIQISMGRTAITNAGTTNNWDTNLPPANRTVVYRGPLDIHHENGAWRGIGLPSSFTFVGTPAEPNLCLEIITWGIKGCSAPRNFYYPRSASGAGSRRAYLYNWVNNRTGGANTGSGASRIGLLCADGNFVVVGAGCNGLKMAGSPPAWPKANTSYTINMSGGANRPSVALLFLGLRLPTPIDLTAAGAPGCTWYVSPLVIGSAVTSGTSGNASLALPVPNLPGVRAWFQWVNRNASANALGYTLSDYATMIIGT